MKLKEITITKGYKGKDPRSSDRFDRIEVGITKTFIFDDNIPIEVTGFQKIKEDIEHELQILTDPDSKWIQDKKEENHGTTG